MQGDCHWERPGNGRGPARPGLAWPGHGHGKCKQTSWSHGQGLVSIICSRFYSQFKLKYHFL